MKRVLCYIVFYFLALSCFSQHLFVLNLQCENTIDPLGVDLGNPRLSWELKSDQRNVLQTAYRILVADDSLLLKKGIGNIWDSKKVISSESIQVKFSGKNLQPVKKYFWKVMLWDNKGNVSHWGKMAIWQMGLLSKSDWMNAKWIAYDEVIDSLRIAPHVHLNGRRSWGPRRNVLPLMRKEFPIF